MAASTLRDFAQAKLLHAKLQLLTSDDARAAQQARWLGAELALAAGDPRQAKERLATGPADLSARPALFLWAQAMTSTGQAVQVAQQLQTWVANHPHDAQAWQFLSAAYAAQGKRLSALRTDAESYAAHLDYAAAGNRLKAAQDQVRLEASTDHIEASIIDTRSRQIATLLREQALER